MARKLRIELDMDLIKDMYLKGFEMTKIANKFNVSDSTIARRLKMLGIHRKGKKKNFKEEQIVELYNKNYSLDKIAKTIGNISGRTVARVLRDLGIKIRQHTKLNDNERKNNYAKKKLANGKSQGQHRYIMEQHLGRKLKDNEVVHHINKKRYDNRIENLQLMTADEHARMHLAERDQNRKRRSENE